MELLTTFGPIAAPPAAVAEPATVAVAVATFAVVAFAAAVVTMVAAALDRLRADDADDVDDADAVEDDDEDNEQEDEFNDAAPDDCGCPLLATAAAAARMWIRSCFFRLPHWAKALLHVPHLNGFSPV